MRRHILSVFTFAMAIVVTGGWLNPVLGAYVLQNGEMEYSGNFSVAPGWTSYRDATTRAVSWSKELSIIHGGLSSQKITYTSPGAGSFAGIRQTIDTQIGDAITLEGWAYPTSANAYQLMALGAQWDGSTERPATWLQQAPTRTAWNQLQGAGNATGTSVTVFLDTRRNTSNGALTGYFDDVLSYHAFVPPAPILGNLQAASVDVDVDPGLNSDNALAEFAISIGGGEYGLETHWVQADGSIGTTQAWLTDAAWGSKTVSLPGDPASYQFAAMARYSGTITQPTFLGPIVPEPATAGLLVLGAVAMLLRRRR